ncbi:hypothetical protein OAG75_00200 [bacterium]|nr:hypothetical protein [bacterium]
MRSAIWSGIWNHNYCDSTDTIAGRFESQKLTMGLTTKLTTGIDHEKTPQHVAVKHVAAFGFALKSRGDTI